MRSFFSWFRARTEEAFLAGVYDAAVKLLGLRADEEAATNQRAALDLVALLAQGAQQRQALPNRAGPSGDEVEGEEGTPTSPPAPGQNGVPAKRPVGRPRKEP
jgi:hypothetical protein